MRNWAISSGSTQFTMKFMQWGKYEYPKESFLYLQNEVGNFMTSESKTTYN